MESKSNGNCIQYSGTPSLKSRVIKRIIKTGSRFIRSKDLYQIRELWDSHGKKLKIPEGLEISRISIAGVECEWILPEGEQGERIIIYLHGGGYVLGSLNTARGLALLFSRYARERVLSVNYRLAPENPFPAGLEDSLAVYRKLLEEGTKPQNIILIGDSAGGGLCLSTVLSLKEKGEPLPGAVVCISPWADLAATGESNKANLKLDPIFGGGSGVIKSQDYAGEESLFNRLISPLYGDYAGFPPLLIHVGTEEVILDDSVRLAEKAEAAGVQVSLKIWKGLWHVFVMQHDNLPEARQALKEIGDFIKSSK